MSESKRAIFLDRDGVLNEIKLNPKTKEYESPHHISELQVIEENYSILKELQKHFQLFIVTNQPSYAKGKTTLEDINEISQSFKSQMAEHGVNLTEYYCCYHHPEGVVPEYTLRCDCRKPAAGFLKQAVEDFDIDLKNSWMVGDRDTDVLCGQSVGTKTILVLNPFSTKYHGKSHPTLTSQNMIEAGQQILKTLE